jgi:hypothetical protein
VLSITSLIVIGAICLMLGINPLELLRRRRGRPQKCRTSRVRHSPRSGSPFEASDARQQPAFAGRQGR